MNLINAVTAYMAHGYKIRAIKLVRSVLDIGLKEAKDWAEGVTDRNYDDTTRILSEADANEFSRTMIDVANEYKTRIAVIDAEVEKKANLLSPPPAPEGVVVPYGLAETMMVNAEMYLPYPQTGMANLSGVKLAEAIRLYKLVQGLK